MKVGKTASLYLMFGVEYYKEWMKMKLAVLYTTNITYLISIYIYIYACAVLNQQEGLHFQTSVFVTNDKSNQIIRCST